MRVVSSPCIYRAEKKNGGIGLKANVIAPNGSFRFGSLLVLLLLQQ